jgi:hypothetical protein
MVHLQLRWLLFHVSAARLGKYMEALGDALNKISGWQLLGLIIALGAVAMALLNLITDLTPLRSAFHAVWLRRWIKNRVEEYLKRATDYAESQREPGQPREPLPDDFLPKADEAFAQLMAQATGGNSRSFLGLRPSQLVAQINAAAHAALESPEPNFSLLAVLSQPAEPYVPLILRATKGSPDLYFEDLEEIVNHMGSYPPPESPALKDYLDARARMAHRIQRNLDSMQIILGGDSAWTNQIFAIGIGICLAYVIVATEETNSSAFWLMTLLLGIAVGYVAPLLGDIVAAIRTLGRA